MKIGVQAYISAKIVGCIRAAAVLVLWFPT